MRHATSLALDPSFPLTAESRFEYDDFGNLAKDRQSHAGAVGDSTPAVAYAHEDGFYNNTRLTAMTYPNGRVVQMGYGTTGGRDDLLSRIAIFNCYGFSIEQVVERPGALIPVRMPSEVNDDFPSLRQTEKVP